MKNGLLKSVMFFTMGIFLLTLNACKKEKAETSKDGLTQDIHNLIPDDILEKIKELGIAINGGNTPPNVAGSYLVTPLVLQKSNFEDSYPPGTKFADMTLTFSQQNNSKQTVKTDYLSGPEVASGLGSFMTGSGNKFSIFVETSGKYFGSPFKAINVYSGEISAQGIKNFQVVIMFTEAGLNTLKKGEGRLLVDDDKISEKQ